MQSKHLNCELSLEQLKQLCYSSRKEVFLLSKEYEQKNEDIPVCTATKDKKNKYKLHCDNNGVLLLPTGAELIAATKKGEVKWFIRDKVVNLPKKIETFYCFYDVAYIKFSSQYEVFLYQGHYRADAKGKPEKISFVQRDARLLSQDTISLSRSEQAELLEIIEKRAINDYYTHRAKMATSQKSWQGRKLGSEWNEESILRSNGYTVAQSEGLTSMERQHILESIIQQGLVTKEQVIKHINHQINIRSNDYNAYAAIKKWEEDIYFLLNSSL